MRILLTLEYDGTAYAGWQRQENALAVQQVVEEAVSKLVGARTVLFGASRTDAGVHAMGNVAVFDTEARMAADKFVFALNQRLPEDICVQDSCEVPMDFHPRFQKTVKTYEYRILNRKFPLPAYRLNTYFYYYPLDVEKMQKAAAYLVGEHDFASFCAAGAQVKTTVRTVYSLDVDKDGDLITIRITGNGFLYNMVRIIAGTLIRTGTGEWEPECVPEILEARSRAKAGPTAPAKGLTLMEIRYPDAEKTPKISEKMC